ncbi:hypothetical protein [Pallidibacillus thermolactis]|jgi:hypothetical protein|uniref:hypothetical protein n=1 Tax=Pallidibacillus thermolactis TaxID=251051 RepID=UPI0021D82186|nr:hypothetical protein [Pallidibacillus thermolactis]MCU9601350.1 hypothetical protein [Pallidibacillus thermolactis subsp. kokeshiiformis]MCU9602644.1 hypothetical protein [Pallidibacillus thermolactis subsp. kokeshiiformis]
MSDELTWVDVFEGLDVPSFSELTIIKKGSSYISYFTSQKDKMGIGKDELESLQNLKKLYED